MARVFLSPSTQDKNVGVGNYGTERYRMNQVTDYAQQALQSAGVEVFRNDPTKSLSDAIKYGNSLDVDAYVAIHSDAGGGRGPTMLINGNRKNSQNLASAVYAEVAAITPAKGRGQKVRMDLGEIRSPKAPSCLIEVSFHDNIADAEWIITHMPQLGTAIANGILTFLSMPKVTDATGVIEQDFDPPVSSYNILDAAKQDILYGRKCKVYIQTKSGVTLDVSQQKCMFKISKTLLMEPNYSEIAIYNLNADTENTIIKEGQRVVIEAGYEGSNYGVIFDGDVIQSIREKVSGTDYVLSVIALDGDRFMNFGFVNYTMAKGMSARAQATDLISKATIPAQLGDISAGLSQAQLTRGKVVFGLTKDYLRSVAQTNNATFYVENGKVNLVQAKDIQAGMVYDLSPTSGLIGTPTQTEYGASIKSLIIPSIKLNSMIHVDNQYIRERQIQIGQIQRTLDMDGLYRVIAVDYSGDTRGNDWYAEYDTITQAGMIPGLIANDGMMPW